MPGKRRPILRNITILAACGALERGLSAIYRIMLARMAGATALGLIQFCLPILRLALILGTLGLPQALTRVTAEALAHKDPEGARRVLLWSLRTSAIAGGGLALLCVALMPVWRVVFPDPRVAPLFYWLAPILFCDCLCLILQANFQGRDRMWPVALAGILGQIGKLAVTLFLIKRALAGGAGEVARAGIIAVALSEGGVLLFLLLRTNWSKAGKPRHRSPNPGALLRSSLPLMGDGLVFAIAATIDMLVIPYRLIHSGLAQGAVAAVIGQVYGMAFPALFLPMVAIWPIAAATLPAVAAARARGDWSEIRRRIALTYGVVGAIAVAATAGFTLFAGPMMRLLYANTAAAPYLQVLALASVPVYLASIGGTFLVGLDLPGVLFKQSLFCAIFRTFLVYILSGLPGLGIYGAMIGIITGNALLAAVNGVAVWRSLNRRKPSKQAGRFVPQPPAGYTGNGL